MLFVPVKPDWFEIQNSVRSNVAAEARPGRRALDHPAPVCAPGVQAFFLAKQTWRDQTMRLCIARLTHDPVTPVDSREWFPSRPAMTTQRRSATMTTQKMFAAVALGLFLGVPGAGEGAVPLHHDRRARIDPDRGQRE